ncbi:protein-glutamate O-methyltransferase CheR [Oceanotoga sp. DSM 15011]|jgi:chemotaxis protein methyltransferase CheR|uniref:protein-glutamate O-methyltransferase n=1 Tax=Oceanotoga teriensis TaxID=515440 RepID=A0AA45HIK4_9BACT|nr:MULTISPECIES: protein-glutamate O-methyltransferase CheR [Oceanotoga]MDN5343366.1 chemotaxis protein methyltransferase CheR [Oceanotoga sp.]MDO7975736.1 protein-glutamate O-methyltransferase CheR [Oceanotoga teriensis]PWJ91285.1 chemotaxis protein methyltransferase CheR [Oceanotoga teriensis]UYO99760.1 protein-glutamate O-methyltransferase CheR [Oceanotoga sp. DSM 15011]
MNNLIFSKFRDYIYENLGIDYNENKKVLLEARIKKLMNRYAITSFESFYNRIFVDKKLLIEFLNEMTTNKTNFFREINHFNFLKSYMSTFLNLNKRINLSKEIRVWSAGCSTGEEAYTVGMVLKEILNPNIIIKILATDISTNVLQKAMQRTYPSTITLDVPVYYLNKYFTKDNKSFRLNDEIYNMVTFRYFNLMNKFPFKHKFDIIFCRNVMIYFDYDTRANLSNKFHKALVKNGLMIIGHSESLSDKKKEFKYMKPTIYSAM